MKMPLRFGIPSLDDLLYPPRHATRGHEPSTDTDYVGTEKICILGPDGTGKSILALHLASRYVAATDGGAKVIFVSTDMDFDRAYALWKAFRLGAPGKRGIPFESPEERRSRTAYPEVELSRLQPSSDGRMAEFLMSTATREVGFLDLATHTAGDDWAYATRILKLSTVADQGSPNLMVLDSIAGFETLVGETDAFGKGSTRRARIAQIVRAAAENWHLAFVVEEPRPGEHRPEEFITDCVIRLRRQTQGEYSRLTLEVEKSRAKGHAHGQHPFEIRDGHGSSTGNWQNADDPVARPVDGQGSNAYIQVFPSLHQINRRVMRSVAALPERYAPKDRFCGFGIAYLDNLLAGSPEPTAGPIGARGLAAGSVTALVGDDGTHKSLLGRYFLQEGFRPYERRFLCLVRALWNGIPADSASELEEILQSIGSSFKDVRPSLRPGSVNLDDLLKRLKHGSHRNDLAWELYRTAISAAMPILAGALKRRKRPRALEAAVTAWKEQHEADALKGLDLMELAKALLKGDRGSEPFMKACRTHLRDWNSDVSEEPSNQWAHASLPWTRLRYPNDWYAFAVEAGSPWHRVVEVANWILRHPALVEPAVLITTRDERAGVLAKEFVKRLLHDSLQRLAGDLELKPSDVLLAEEECSRTIAGHIVCRRLAIHDAPSALLIHILEKSLDEALELSFGSRAAVIGRLYPSSEGAWTTRVVVDDLRVLANTYPDVKNDSLFLPYLIFRLQRRGVTSLLLGTYAGRPSESTPSDPVDAELRALTGHQIHTWKVSFYGENRVAVTVIPAMTSGASGVVRELREVDRKDLSFLLVDPRFELFSGIEEGKPEAVPLQVQIFTETRAFKDYIAAEEGFWRQRFLPFVDPGGTESAVVLKGIDAQQLNYVRELCHLPRDEGRPYTLLFPLDMYWALMDSGALLDRKSYLTEDLPSSRNSERASPEENFADPFGLFRDTQGAGSTNHAQNQCCRLDYFKNLQNPVVPNENPGYKCPIERNDKRMDRVPFMWDFGFLLCRKEAWEAAQEIELRQYNKSVPEDVVATVGAVWSRLIARCPTSTSEQLKRTGFLAWRAFFEACREVAKARALKTCKPAVAFDLAAISPDSISCLVLEIWASEIYASLKQHRHRKTKFLGGITSHRGSTDGSEGLMEWLDEPGADLKSVYRGVKAGGAVEPQSLLAGAVQDLAAVGRSSRSRVLCQREQQSGIQARSGATRERHRSPALVQDGQYDRQQYPRRARG